MLIITISSFLTFVMYPSRISSDYFQGFALLTGLLRWLFYGKGWRINQMMGFLIGMLLAPRFVILVLRFISYLNPAWSYMLVYNFICWLAFWSWVLLMKNLSEYYIIKKKSRCKGTYKIYTWWLFYVYIVEWLERRKRKGYIRFSGKKREFIFFSCQLEITDYSWRKAKEESELK